MNPVLNIRAWILFYKVLSRAHVSTVFRASYKASPEPMCKAKVLGVKRGMTLAAPEGLFEAVGRVQPWQGARLRALHAISLP